MAARSGVGVSYCSTYLSSLLNQCFGCAFLFPFFGQPPPRRISRLYPFKLHMRSIVPFSDRWQEDVAPEHVEPIEKFRKTFLTFFTAFLILAF